jgi:nitroreductase
MDFSQVLQNRRSVRKYQARPVEREKLEQCVEAARIAPSACNAQPWKFLIIDDEETKKRFAREVFSGIYRETLFAARAPALAMMVTDPLWLPPPGEFTKPTNYHLIDIGIAGEHFVLKATEMGLGTCWIGRFDEEKAKQVLGIPEGHRIEILIAVGYPAEESIQPKEKKPLKSLFVYNHWGK